MLTLLVSPVDARPLGIARVVIGSASAIRSLVALPVLLKLADPQFATVPVFSWMPMPSRPLAIGLVAVWFSASVLLVLGWRLPVAGSAVLACLVFLMALDWQTYSNHIYFMALLVLLLVLGDAGAALSVERRTRPIPMWPAWLMMVQVSVVYGFSAITKLNDDFLSGRVLAGVLRDGIVAFPEALRTPRFLGAVAVAAVLSEAFLAFALWSARLRWIAFVVGFGLHSSITLLMADTLELMVFSLLIVAVYPLFAAMANKPGGVAEPT